MAWKRRSASVGVALLLTIGLWLLVGRDVVAREQALRRARSLYGRVPPYPGAVKQGEDVSEVAGDDGGTGEYAVTLTYRLPSTAKAKPVIDYLRSHLPSDWHVASDETCRRVMASQPPAPVATMPDGMPVASSPIGPESFVLLAKATQLTAFTGNEDGTPNGYRNGVTFELKRDGAKKLLLIHESTFGCAQHDGGDSKAFDSH